jgi:hypothetical protein
VASSFMKFAVGECYEFAIMLEDECERARGVNCTPQIVAKN